ncbi:hypothetical protein EGR_08126 [Echinococcus granulosus]|uniref:Uncharacterized protein n=1 Tax=Echinococcus granulosus TaxID=6210 RepID=W6U792_ECHGR|nr:hypothetical protein EGR_08126 [Echinococcus granulosus]EUB57050.1 hypothetical protein EGR_08126 [Echinococcus granulosus]
MEYERREENKSKPVSHFDITLHADKIKSHFVICLPPSSYLIFNAVIWRFRQLSACIPVSHEQWKMIRNNNMAFNVKRST